MNKYQITMKETWNSPEIVLNTYVGNMLDPTGYAKDIAVTLQSVGLNVFRIGVIPLNRPSEGYWQEQEDDD